MRVLRSAATSQKLAREERPRSGTTPSLSNGVFCTTPKPPVPASRRVSTFLTISRQATYHIRH
eukprot:5311082-Pleurochrysis_carterae.AAC.1